MIVSGLDWSPVHNMLVSCSHDRNAFVWKFDNSERNWKPSLVLLRINRAALNVKWSPDGTYKMSRVLGIAENVLTLDREQIRGGEWSEVCACLLLRSSQQLVDQ